MTVITDKILQPLVPGDFVAHYNDVYEVMSLPAKPTGQIRIMLARPSKTTRPVMRYPGDLFRLGREEVLHWLREQDRKDAEHAAHMEQVRAAGIPWARGI